MIADRFGGVHATKQARAVRAFEEAVVEMLAHRRGCGAALDSALAADSQMVAAHALSGFAQVLLARSETMEVARGHLAAARSAASGQALTAFEQAMLRALELAVDGRWVSAAAALEDAPAEEAVNVLCLKLGQALRFLSGDRTGMLRASCRAIDSARDDLPGFGFAMGCHAFSLEENGRFEAAERAAQMALHSEPQDVWAMHALAHVYEMQGRTGEGVLWLESARDVWINCHNFSFHMAWHLALFQTDRGRFDRALDIYDNDVRPWQTDDFRDFHNAVSLLWQLRQDGVDTGNRFDELADVARRRAKDSTLVFASLNHLVSLLSVKDFIAAGEVVAALKEAASVQAAEDDAHSQNIVARDVGLPVARALVAHAQSTSTCGELAGLAAQLMRIGGSNAQREMFIRHLAYMAADDCDRATLRAILDIRHQMRAEDRFARTVEARMLSNITGANSLDVA